MAYLRLRHYLIDALLDGSHQLVQGDDMSFGFSHDVVEPRRTESAAQVPTPRDACDLSPVGTFSGLMPLPCSQFAERERFARG